jgi:hypothetical protein
MTILFHGWGDKMPDPNNGVSLLVYVATVGGVFSTLWGIIWKIQQNKIKDIDDKVEDEVFPALESKATQKQLDRVHRECESWLRNRNKTFEEFKRDIIEENRKDKSFLYKEIENQGNDLKKWFDKFDEYQQKESIKSERRAAFEARMEEKTSKMERDLSFLIDEIGKD